MMPFQINDSGQQETLPSLNDESLTGQMILNEEIGFNPWAPQNTNCHSNNLGILNSQSINSQEIGENIFNEENSKKDMGKLIQILQKEKQQIKVDLQNSDLEDHNSLQQKLRRKEKNIEIVRELWSLRLIQKQIKKDIEESIKKTKKLEEKTKIIKETNKKAMQIIMKVLMGKQEQIVDSQDQIPFPLKNYEYYAEGNIQNKLKKSESKNISGQFSIKITKGQNQMKRREKTQKMRKNQKPEEKKKKKQKSQNRSKSSICKTSIKSLISASKAKEKIRVLKKK